MSKRSQEKRRARSKEKVKAKRRMQGMSPLSRLAGTAEETCECWMTCSQDDRMLGLHVMRPLRGGDGRTVAAFFLVDRDCIGVKDAFCRLNVDPIELREKLRARSGEDGMRVVRMELGRMREIMAGAIRWTRMHPFRVPADIEKCLKILGGVGDIEGADISDFGGKDGDLMYVGRQVDLEKCLRGITMEEFLERDDVDVVFHFGNETFGDAGEFEEEEEYEEEEDEEEWREEDHKLEVGINALIEATVEAVRKMCAAQGTTPSGELELAAKIRVFSLLAGATEEQKGETPESAMMASTEMFLEQFNQLNAATQAEVKMALEQITACKEAGVEAITQAAAKKMRDPMVDVSPMPHSSSPLSTEL